MVYGNMCPIRMAFVGIDDKEKIYRWLYRISKPLIFIIVLTYILEFKVWVVYLGEYRYGAFIYGFVTMYNIV